MKVETLSHIVVAGLLFLASQSYQSLSDSVVQLAKDVHRHDLQLAQITGRTSPSTP